MYGLDPDDPLYYARPTPPLSAEGIAEIIAELDAPPRDTPERRRTFERARELRFLVEQALAQGIPPAIKK